MAPHRAENKAPVSIGHVLQVAPCSFYIWVRLKPDTTNDDERVPVVSAFRRTKGLTTGLYRKNLLQGRMAALAVTCAILGGACGQNGERTASIATNAAPAAAAGSFLLKPPRGLGLHAVKVPDFAAMEASVRAQMRAQYSSLAVRIEHPANRDELGDAYGELGELLMAATYFEAAEVCYLNAQTLAPTDMRWPYYLGHLYKAKGPLTKSLASFAKALELRPNDVATLVWLGDTYVIQGRSDAAEPLFNQALRVDANSAAAHFGAGRTALAKKDYVAAVTHLEKALALDPQATATHYPLAMAYRGRGDMAKAEAELGKKGDVEPRPADPLMRHLDQLLESAEAYNVRGGRELDAGNWAAAAEHFRKGLGLKPADPSLGHRLGTALYQMGDVSGAIEQLQRVIRTSPEYARAHFSLAVVLEAGGRHREAIEHFSEAVKSEPGYIQARVQLAGVLARSGRPDEALSQYQLVLERDPALKEAVFGYAMTLVRLHRYASARDRLADAMKVYPDDPVFAHTLARLLAAAPDPHVRDGRRAKALVDRLLKKQQNIELGETAAMTLAELGEYDQAAAVQRDLIAAAEKAGLHDVVRHLAINLELYNHRQPCRTPFADDELP
jgi:tetratricopeptide (TPR) repeat protein